jgi:hypothetical protein
VHLTQPETPIHAAAEHGRFLARTATGFAAVKMARASHTAAYLRRLQGHSIAAAGFSIEHLNAEAAASISTAGAMLKLQSVSRSPARHLPCTSSEFTTRRTTQLPACFAIISCWPRFHWKD